MFKLEELIGIIKQLNNSASFKDIIMQLQIKNEMLLFYNHEKYVRDLLGSHPDIFYYDSVAEMWSVIENNDQKDIKNLIDVANSYNGGIAKFIDILNANHIMYTLTSKKPSIKISIPTIYGVIEAYDRNIEIKIRLHIPFTHPLSTTFEFNGGYLYNERNENYKANSHISVYFDENSFEYLAHEILKTQNNAPFKLSMEELYKVLKRIDELDPNVHDGSYELVQETINEYKKLEDLSKINVDDINFIYSITIGTWKASTNIRKERLKATHLSQNSKDVIFKLIDKIWENACKNLYDNSIVIPKKPGYGMFGTGFMSFKGKLSDDDSKKFIALMIDISKETDELKIYQKAEEVINAKSFLGKGLKTGSASIMLHCLKPFVFPIINGNDKHGTIYERVDIKINRIRELKTYISNCRVIKKYRDENFKFKNYRILDMATWALDSNDFNYEKFFHLS